jgi:acyl-CoA synthetase (AMP-forming)/AMP-acid ligase II
MTGLEYPFNAQTLIDLLIYRAIHQPDQTAYRFLVDGETETVSLTYAQLDRQAKAIALIYNPIVLQGIEPYCYINRV